MGRKITKELSIIICAYNKWRYSAKCLASILKSSYPKEKYHIYFIDNASTDKTETLVSYLVEQGEPITYLKQKENLGFVKGNNLGWKFTETPYVMLLNNDAYVNFKTIDRMIDIIKSDEKIGAVGAEEFTIDYIPTKGDKPFVFFKPKSLLDPELKSLEDLGYKKTEIPTIVDVDIIGSACSIIRKEALKGEPIFDERFHPAHWDQEDAWMRIKYVNGYRVVISTFDGFNHSIAGTTSDNLELYTNILKINKQKFLDKWLEYWKKRDLK